MITDHQRFFAVEVGAVKFARWPMVPAYQRYFDVLGFVVAGSWGVQARRMKRRLTR